MKAKKRFVILGIVLLILIFAYFRNRRMEGLSIEPLKRYALNCTPCKDELNNLALRDAGVWCIQPPVPQKDVLKVLSKRRIDEEYMKWVLLVYLKLHEKQVMLYNQSFEVRESPFFLKRFNSESELTKAFCEVIGEGVIVKKLGPEYLPASKAYEYINEHKLFARDTVIQRQMSTIKKLLDQHAGLISK